MLAVGYLGRAPNFLGHRGKQAFHHLHDLGIVGVGLIAFQQAEFRIVILVDALVAKHPAQFVDFVEPPHYQPFQVQLGGDAQI